MSSLVSHIIASGLLGAIIGAVAGLLTSDFMPEGAVGGAVIGAIIGAFLGTRIKAYQGASANAVRHHIEGTRSVGSARNELINATRIDQNLASGIHTGAEAKRRDD